MRDHVGTIDFYHVRPLSLVLTLARGHKVSAKQIFAKPVGFFFSHTFQLIMMHIDLIDVLLKQYAKLNILNLLLSEV